MGNMLNGYILPHPPIIVPEVGNGREIEAIRTVEAVKRAAKEIALDDPSTIILSSPHAPCFRDYVYLTDSEELSGDLSAFGHPKVKIVFENNMELLSSIITKATEAGIGAGSLNVENKKRFRIDDRLDHGALVPLYFIDKELKGVKLVHISTPFLPFDKLYEFGKCMAAAVSESDERVVYVASGDLSHRLTKNAPSGYSPKGREYDEYLVEKIRRGDTKGLLQTDEEFLESAGECGTRSIIMMLGALNDRKITTDVYSYEGPFGVGYLIAKVGWIRR